MSTPGGSQITQCHACQAVAEGCFNQQDVAQPLGGSRPSFEALDNRVPPASVRRAQRADPLALNCTVYDPGEDRPAAPKSLITCHMASAGTDMLIVLQAWVMLGLSCMQVL